MPEIDERTMRVAIIVIGHVMWLSTAALRLVRGHRGHAVRADAPWLVRYYTVLVWIPLVFATLVFKWPRDVAYPFQATGLALALAGSLFAAWSMWSLGRGYGIGLDVFEGHRLKTDGPFALVRHPMYLGIVTYHVGAALALESLALIAATALVVVPYTAWRVACEEQVLREAFREYDRYAERTPRLVPLARARP
ncbi:MAG TPA: isoprenylcysteine carboxylmethyltransferase family protein [Candidatus Limnocylindria bacterium]|nr:isoprenylcysteine carboxylmethyltransferase family protein [Candidatus Limnocylindria bacterium]